MFGDEGEDTLWYAMPLARQSLGTRLDDGVLNPKDALDIFRQICNGVSHLHEVDIVHRDLKPGNALEIEAGRWVVSDLGYARSGRASSTRITESGDWFGTPWYCPPEQFADAHSVLDTYRQWASTTSGSLITLPTSGVVALRSRSIPGCGARR